MKPSEITLLRKELIKVTTEYRNFQNKMAKLESNLIRKNTLLELEIDRLRLELAAGYRRMETYENSNASSSTGSLYNAERAAFRKKMETEGTREDGPEPNDKDKARKGPPVGNAGASHGNKAERTVTLHVRKCERCGHGCISGLPSKVKMVYDFAADGTMRVECVAYVIERAACKKCGEISSATPPTIPGTSLGPRALGFVEEYYAKRSTDQTISYYFDALYGFKISPNAVWNARKALRSLLMPTYRDILDCISEAPFVQFDESSLKMNGRKGYVWLVTTGDATYLVAAPSRAAIILDRYFSRLLDIPVVVDWYTVYNAFPIKQRCGVHILRKAEKFAIRKGGNYLSCYLRLLAMYKGIKDRESAGCVECLDLERAVLEIAASYGEAEGKKEHDGLKFKATLEYAAPCLFTLLRYHGMPPHNNGAELEIRDAAVLHRNVRHQISEPEGREVFSVLISVARTCHKQGIFPRVAVEELIRDPDWSIFKPPPPTWHKKRLPPKQSPRDAEDLLGSHVWGPESIPKVVRIRSEAQNRDGLS